MWLSRKLYNPENYCQLRPITCHVSVGSYVFLIGIKELPKLPGRGALKGGLVRGVPPRPSNPDPVLDRRQYLLALICFFLHAELGNFSHKSSHSLKGVQSKMIRRSRCLILKLYTLFKTQNLENHTLFSSTYK